MASVSGLLISTPNVPSLLHTKPKPSLPSPTLSFFNPSSTSSTPLKPHTLFSTRRTTSHREAVLSPKTWAFRQSIASCLGSDEFSELPSDSQPTNTSLTEATIDIQLPRRSLLVQFTCNACSERTKRLINRLAYERGTVFVQCAGCLKHHKLVDNLGLIIEYDLREDTNKNLNADQV